MVQKTISMQDLTISVSLFICSM